MVLSGWKAIADYIGKSVRMAQYYVHHEPSIPVYGWGDRGPVEADTAQLDLWLKSMRRHRGMRHVADRCAPVRAGVVVKRRNRASGTA